MSSGASMSLTLDDEPILKQQYLSHFLSILNVLRLIRKLVKSRT